MKWFKLKVVAVIMAGVVLCLGLGTLLNSFVYDFVGIDASKVLARENDRLQAQIRGLQNEIREFEHSIAELQEHGNQLRLMVDLPTIDAETRSGGTGGTAMQQASVIPISGGMTQVLNSTKSLLSRLSGEMKVQEQSYREIVSKYEYNKGFFAALPALKPMEGFYSMKEFGLRMHPVLGVFKTHEGLDIVNDVGTLVVASGDGIVEMAGQSGGGYGTVVVIKHGYGYQTLYAHLSKVLVREGKRVRRGDPIGKSGKTGLVSGPHLHYEVRYNGVCQNPANYFFDDVRIEDYRKQIASR
jgi:murein DD-endopeptidase MepM/ murein hydrolase activator NlpD